MLDLTFSSFACRRVPLVVASVALLVGAMGTVRWKGQCAFLTTALMMVIFFQAARLAIGGVRPSLVFSCPCKCSSEAFPWQIDRGPPILHIFIDLLLYWSYSPPSEPPFLQHGIGLLRCRSSANDAQLKNLWLQLERCYAVAAESAFSRFDKLLGATNIQTVVASGGRILMTNEPLGGPNLQGR
jgi:hypothetical protein